MYRAVPEDSGGEVAVKVLPLPLGMDAKEHVLAQREAEVLRQLDHPAIPSFHGLWFEGRGRARCMYLVVDFVQGRDLATELRSHRYTEHEVVEIIAEVARVLAYLHSLSPPVIHRDLKPANVIRRASDGRLMLVDFGAVRDAISAPGGGSTVAGTFGFMAPEQFRGVATPATDVFGLGALGIALLTRRDPSELHDRSGKFSWSHLIDLRADTERLLEDMVAPDPASRLGSATELVDRAERIARNIVALVEPEPVRGTRGTRGAAVPRTPQPKRSAPPVSPYPATPAPVVDAVPVLAAADLGALVDPSPPQQLQRAKPSLFHRLLPWVGGAFGTSVIGVGAALAAVVVAFLAVIAVCGLLGLIVPSPSSMSDKLSPSPTTVETQPQVPPVVERSDGRSDCSYGGVFPEFEADFPEALVAFRSPVPVGGPVVRMPIGWDPSVNHECSVEITVGVDGRVRGATVGDGEGGGAGKSCPTPLRRAMCESYQNWEFEPAHRNGEAVDDNITFTVPFGSDDPGSTGGGGAPG